MPEVSTCAGLDLEPLHKGDGKAQAQGTPPSSPDLQRWLVKCWLEVSAWDENSRSQQPGTLGLDLSSDLQLVLRAGSKTWDLETSAEISDRE